MNPCCLSKKHVTPSGCVGTRFTHGETKVSLKPSTPQGVTVDTTAKTLSDTQGMPVKKLRWLKSVPVNPLCCTHGSALRSKKMTLNDKHPSYGPIYLTNLPPRDPSWKSEMSEVGSTSTGGGSKGFWNLSMRDLYRTFWWPLGTDCVASDLNSLNGCSKSTMYPSWYSRAKIQPQSRNSQKTLWPSYKFTVADGMATAGTERAPKTLTKALKLRLKPTKDQKSILNSWSHAARFTYNKAISVIRNPKEPKKGKNKLKVRDRYVTARYRKDGKMVPNPFFKNRQWLLDCPKAIRKGAIDGAFAAWKAAHTNKLRGHQASYEMGFQTRKDQDLKGWSLYLEKANVRREGVHLFIFPEILGEMKYASSKQLEKLLCGKTRQLKKSVCVHPEMDCRLQKDRYGDFYLIVPIQVTVRKDPTGRGVASMDPGIRKWLVTYSPDKEESYIFGSRFMETLWPTMYRVDKLVSEMVEQRGKKRAQTAILVTRLRKQIFQKKQEMLFQTANTLTKEYSMLLVPHLDTTGFVSSPWALKAKKYRREMMNTCHGRFVALLEQKCLERGVAFVPVTEEYTSQTCPNCGCLHKTSSETKCCPQCHLEADRDLVGALNIFLRTVRMGEAPTMPS